MAALPHLVFPDSLNVLTSTHDTLQVVLRDGATLMAEISNLPKPPDAWSRTWPVLTGALVGGFATIAAQAFRAHIDRNKEREEMRLLMSLLVWRLEGWLEKLIIASEAHLVVSGHHFWQECDDLLAGRDNTGRSLSLLPGHIGIHTWLWFNRVASFRARAKIALTEVIEAYSATSMDRERRERVDEHEEWLTKRGHDLSREAEAIVKDFNTAIPKGWWQRLGTSKDPFQVPGIKIGN